MSPQVGATSLRGKYHVLVPGTTTGLCGQEHASLGVKALNRVYVGNVCAVCRRRQQARVT